MTARCVHRGVLGGYAETGPGASAENAGTSTVVPISNEATAATPNRRQRPSLALRDVAVVSLTGSDHGSALRALSALLPELGLDATVQDVSPLRAAGTIAALLSADGTVHPAHRPHAA